MKMQALVSIGRVAGRRGATGARGWVGAVLERLEGRELLAAHIAGDATVYGSIGEAVAAAAAGATITVDPGVYAEMVYVTKPLTLRGAQAGHDARWRCSACETVVTGYNLGTQESPSWSTSFVIRANDVTLNGFTVRGNTSTGAYGAGVVMGPGVSGTRIVNDIIEYNIAGLYLANASAGDAAIIRHSRFENNNTRGDNSGRAIYSDAGISGGLLTTVRIEENAFLDNYGTSGVEAAIGLESATAHSQFAISITDNVFYNNGKAVLAMNVSGLTIAGNVMANSRDAGSAAVRFEGGVSNVVIALNLFANNAGAAVMIDNKYSPLANANITICYNVLLHNGAGIVSTAATTGLVTQGNLIWAW